MKNEDALMLEHYGWSVECQSPFEIRHGDGSFATGQAANIVLLALKGDWFNDNQKAEVDE